MNCQNHTVEGAHIYYDVSIELPGGLTMDDIDFICFFFVRPSRFVKINKANMKRMDKDHYTAIVDTSKTGPGILQCQAEATLPDGRIEIERTMTIERILNGMQ